MKDVFFFGGAAVLSIAMISVALASDPRSIPTSPMSVGGDGPRDVVKVGGLNLYRFHETRRDTVTMIRKEGQDYYVRLTSRRNSDFYSNAKDVANLPLSTDLELAFAQRNLKISITARSAPENGSPAMRAEYWASSDGNSDWRTFLLTPEWQTYTFTFKPPQSDNDRGLDYLAVWADPDGLGRGVEVSQVIFDAREK